MATATTNLLRDNDGQLSAYAWPGGYPVVYILDDGEVLCPKCANKHGHQRDDNDGFRLIGDAIHWEGPPMTCAHCNTSIESAYGMAMEATSAKYAK